MEPTPPPLVHAAPWWEALPVAWWSWMLPMAAQIAVVGAIVAAIDLLFLRKPRPRVETLLWALVVVKLVLPPWLGSPISVTRLVLERPLWESPSSIDLGWVQAAAGVWLLGVLLIASAGVLRYRQTQRAIARASSPADSRTEAAVARAAATIGLRHPPRARLVERVEDAAIFGLVDPVVLVPRELLGERERLEHVLLHECAHLKRRDPWWALLTLALSTLYWFHPVVWMTRARLAALRELACDAHVSRLLGDRAAGYRETLLEVARSLLRRDPAPTFGRLAFLLPSPRSIANAFWAHGAARLLSGWWGGSLLVARLTSLGDAHDRQRGSALLSGLGAFAFAALLAVTCLPLANPPTPLVDQWQSAQGCLQKRFLILRALSLPEANPLAPAAPGR